jgi:hypothetical protein
MSDEFDRRFDPSRAVRNGQLGAKDRDKIRLSHPTPWSVEETATCFVVRDRNGQVLTCLLQISARPAIGRVLAR